MYSENRFYLFWNVLIHYSASNMSILLILFSRFFIFCFSDPISIFHASGDRKSIYFAQSDDVCLIISVNNADL